MRILHLAVVTVATLLAAGCQTPGWRPSTQDAVATAKPTATPTGKSNAKPTGNSGFLDFNIYPYTEVRSDNAFTMNALVNMPDNLQYFGFVNLGRDASRDELEETDSYLTEQNLRWTIPETNGLLQVTAQAFLRSGIDNDALRLGLRLKMHKTPGVSFVCGAINLKYWVDVHALQFDHISGTQWQIEHVYRIDVLPALFDGRVYIGGFADHNINHESGPRHTWVQEAQLGVRTYGNVYLVVEQRYNGYRVNNKSSVGVGVEYVMRF